VPAGFGFIIGGMNAPPGRLLPAEHHFAPGFVAILVGYGTADRTPSRSTDAGSLPPLFDM